MPADTSVTAGAVVARIATVALALGCPKDPVAKYLAATAEYHARFSRVACPDTFNALRLVTYRHGVGDPDEVRRAAAAAGVDSEIAAGFVQGARFVSAEGLYTGVEIAGNSSRFLAVADSNCDLLTVTDALGSLGVIGAPRSGLQRVSRGLSTFGMTLGITINRQGAATYHVISKFSIGDGSEARALGIRLAEMMRELEVPAQHAYYVADNFPMFTPPGSAPHTILTTVSLDSKRLAPRLSIEFLRLPKPFVVDILRDFGKSREVAGRMARLEGILNIPAAADGNRWVDALTLSHQGESAPQAGLTWEAPPEHLGAAIDIEELSPGTHEILNALERYHERG